MKDMPSTGMNKTCLPRRRSCIATGKTIKIPVTPASVLMPRRREDCQNDLWVTFQRVQENMIRGLIGRTEKESAPRRVRLTVLTET